ncbi:hypothetical protein N9Z08_02390 [Pirellulales bacterium]|nr:hypothetical protein [Pirellulales bacterium]
MAAFGEVYAKILKQYNEMDVPQCVHCTSTDTASVECGIIRLTMALSANCRKFKLIGNGPKPAEWYCNSCKLFFNKDGSEPLPEDAEHEPQSVEECLEAMKKHGGFTMNINKLLSP